MSSHPLPVGARVRHYGQQWPAARAGTATIREVDGPLRDGTYEYRVTTTVDFSRRPGPDNPETRNAWWSSLATIPATQPTPESPVTIKNTTAAMNDRGEALLLLAASMGRGGIGQAIEEQEKAGQAQLVNSDRLPTDMRRVDPAVFEALGFQLGDADPSDPMFRPATLPDGWKREGSDHDMWSYIVDEHGRHRVSIFYKAAFYDRSAFMNLINVTEYVRGCHSTNTGIVTDSWWATPAAVAAAAHELADNAQNHLDTWARPAYDGDEDALRYRAEYTAERDAYRALASQHTTN